MFGRISFGIAVAIALALMMPQQAFASSARPQATTQVSHVVTAPAAPAALAAGRDKVSNRQENKIAAGPAIHQNQISIGGCGFLQNCLYFNHTDQRAILSGGAAGIGAVICIVGSPAACVVAAVVVGAALVYLGNHGICSGNRRLRVRWFPTVGGAKCVS